jgi:hypothetical protein
MTRAKSKGLNNDDDDYFASRLARHPPALDL